MNQIDKRYWKECGNLDAVSFFHYLVQEGSRLSYLSSARLEAIQIQLVALLADQFNRRTGGQSSSVSVETGQSIQQSVFYTIGYYLKSLPDQEYALEALKICDLKDLLQLGKKLIKTDFKEAEKLLYTVRDTRFTTDIFAYNDTLNEGMTMFFSCYDMDYEAHESPASIDYPLSNDKMNLTGIDYIYDYLQKLQKENEFCNRFSGHEVHSLLRGYDRLYRELLVNVFELVLTNAIGAALLSRNEISLQISEYDRLYLKQSLAALPAAELEERVNEAISLLCGKLSISDQLADYMKTSAVKLKTRLNNALETDSLKLLFLSTADEDDAGSIRYEDKGKLDHDSFRKLADAIRECRYSSDKIALLGREPLSMADLRDLLEGSCFFGEEFSEVFRSLEDIQLALLVKEMPLDPDGTGSLDEETCLEWHLSCNTFLSQMEPLRKSTILTLSQRIVIGSDN